MNGYSISFNAERDVAEIDFRDRFVAETIIPIIQELKTIATGVERKGIVWDLRQADLSDLTMASLREIFALKNKIRPIRPLYVACVVSSPTDAHIIKLWAEGFEDTKQYFRRWFFTPQEAHAWIRSQVLTEPYGADDDGTAGTSDGPTSSAGAAG